MDTILVPLDGSPLAERTLPYAEALAERTGARLLLFRGVIVDSLPGVDVREAEATLLGEAREYLDGHVRRLSEAGFQAEANVASHGINVSGGEVAETILAEAARSGADLVALCTHGRSGLGRVVYGSVAEGVLTHAHTPVLLVRAWHAEVESVELGERPVLLVPLDGAALAETALPLAERLADELSGELALLRAITPPSIAFTPDGIMAASLGAAVEAGAVEAEEYLRRVAERLAGEGRPVRTEVRVGAPADVITDASRELGAALVVMAPHNRTGLGRIVFGSVSGEVLREGTTPLVLAPTAAPASA